jgi:membrane-bound lytic murein transglycosylase D
VKRLAGTDFSGLRRILAGVLIALLAAASPMGAPSACAAEERIPFPPELQPAVDFWIRVYTEISTSEGFLHDERNLSVVYRRLKFERDVTPAARRAAVDAEREKIEAMLRRLGQGATDLSEDERKIAEMFGPGASPSRFADAARTVRFQLGQADRFREGLERSGQWEAHIAQAFANLGLPPELSALPHVESSFDPTAYSKVGAAGLWQFMRGTGRRYMRVDDAVDERMDPFRATEAAAQLLDFNYRFLGSWPLALTAYNHGAAGMRRARDSMGTEDLATIIDGYKSRSFGFASRNFYVCFLAALTIDRNPEKYFSDIKRGTAMRFTELELPAYVPASELQKLLKLERSKLAALNPAVRPAVWSGSRYLPKGYRLRLPADAAAWTPQQLGDALGRQNLYAGQPRARSYKVKGGDSLASIAHSNDMEVKELAQLNNLSVTASVGAGKRLRLPDLQPARVFPDASMAANTPPPAVVPAPAEEVQQALADQRAEEKVLAQRPKAPEPVTAAQAREESPSLAPGGAVAQAAESIDYGISADAIRVAAEETLGHYADWLGVPASRLRSLNRMTARSPLVVGRSLKMDFSNATHEQFDEKRRAYHDAMQASFFAGHRITGTQVYVIRRGDSLWNVIQRSGGLPTWLVMHYNPDVDFNNLRAGVQIVIPKIEAMQAA